MAYAALSKAIEDRLGIFCYGYLPKMENCSLESRHLGLVTADEVTDLKEKMSALAAQVEKTINLDGLLALSRTAPDLAYNPIELPRREPGPHCRGTGPGLLLLL